MEINSVEKKRSQPFGKRPFISVSEQDYLISISLAFASSALGMFTVKIPSL